MHLWKLFAIALLVVAVPALAQTETPSPEQADAATDESVAPEQAAAADADADGLGTKDARISYWLGIQVGQLIKGSEFEIDMDALTLAMRWLLQNSRGRNGRDQPAGPQARGGKT